MKRQYTFLILALLSLFTTIDLEAIGGRGGGGRSGGGGGGRGAGGGGSVRTGGRAQDARGGGRDISSRGGQGARPQQNYRTNYPSPSMSRADGRGNMGQRPQAANGASRPTAAQVQQFMKPGASGGQFNRQSAQASLQQFSQSGANRPALSQEQKQSFKNSLPQRQQENKLAQGQVNNQFRQQHPNAGNWFNNDFYARHNYHPNFYNPRANWWQAATWSSAAAWIGLARASQVYYYNDGGYPIDLTYQDASTYAPAQQNIYVNAQPSYEAGVSNESPSSQEPIQGDMSSQDQENWLPLGIFAVGSDATEASYSNMIVQLALSKDGFISGTYYNAGSDQTYPIEGMVNKDTQQAVWKLSNDAQSPVMSTGLYNLTQDVATVQVHFPNDTDQTRTLVRLQQ